MAMRVNELRKGHVIKEEGELWQIVDLEHVKPGKGPAYFQIKKRNLSTGRIGNQRYNASAEIEFAFLETKEFEYGWQEGDDYVFMDTEGYEQHRMAADVVSDVMPYLKANDRITVRLYEGRPIVIDLPPVVELEVVETEPAVKGDTVTNVYKPARLETGLEIKVPMFIAVGEVVRVQTATGEFSGRVSR